MALLHVDDAIAIILKKITSLDSEVVALNDAGNRVLAAAILAKRTQPPFNASAMDGYAVRYQDLKKLPTCLKVIGESVAGRGFSGSIQTGQAIRIFTGAPVPHDADTVVIQEKTHRSGNDHVEIIEETSPHANIRLSGNDFRQGEKLLNTGHILSPASLALIAAAGHDNVTVTRKARIALLSTGDELVPAGTTPAPDQIIASNAYGLRQIINHHHGQIFDLGIAKDRKESIREAVVQAQQLNVDLLLTSGGVSVGDYDLVQTVLTECGMDLDFWKIAMRPGKPLMFGELTREHTMFVMGLPGNPVSSLVCAQLFLVPLLEKMAGRHYTPHVITAKLATGLPANNAKRQHYIRAQLSTNQHGDLIATPSTSNDSSLLSVMAHSQGLIINDSMAPALEAGDICQVFIPAAGL